MARRYRKRSKRKQEESLGELLATATAIITLITISATVLNSLRKRQESSCMTAQSLRSS